MPKDQHKITPADILPLDRYAGLRKDLREMNVERKKMRRLEVGPHVSVFFENYDTMWMQIQEMLYIEKGGEEQMADELAAYNPMIPNGRELTCTLMFEIPEEEKRRQVLATLGGVEQKIFLEIGGERVQAVPEGDVERSTEEGKASSVHFLHFPMTDEQIAAFRDENVPIRFSIEHDSYGHIAMIGEAMRKSLAEDFD